MTTNVYERKPWSALLPRQRIERWQQFDSMLDVFRSTVTTQPDGVVIRYFDTLIRYQDLDRMSDRFASWLAALGAKKGDRVCLIMQNVPQFVVAVVGAWKVGAIPTPSNPMYREPELLKLFVDCTPMAVICHEENESIVLGALKLAGLDSPVLTTRATDFQTRNDTRVMPTTPSESMSGLMKVLLDGGAGKIDSPSLTSQDLGLLMYTSGTTGQPKGVMTTHRSLVFNAQAAADWFDLSESTRILGVAPLFHITGFELHICLTLLARASVVLTYRFQAQTVLDALLEHRPTFSIGAITAFLALMNAPESSREHFASFQSIYSGGAPIPPPLVDKFKSRFNVHIRGTFGMTELTTGSHYVPLGSETPVDPASGAFAIGIPIFQTEAMIVDEADQPVAVGEPGELLVRGPQMMLGYWNKPVETAETIRNGWLHTGDICLMDASGWFYLVDRKKDVIIASGFKVWPREVEDVLYSHPAIREAAVIGIPDAYRGESVKACIALRPQTSVESDEIRQFCRERLAAYKVPAVVEVLHDLPKTVSGKIMRAELRRREWEGTAAPTQHKR